MKKACCFSALLLVSLTLSPLAASQSEIKPEKRVLIKEILALTEADKMAVDMLNQMIAQMDGKLPQGFEELLFHDPQLSLSERQQLKKHFAEDGHRISKRFRELLPQRINFTEAIEQVLYPLYDKHFTEEDLRELAAFYRSAAGRKFIKIYPQFLQEASIKSSEALTPGFIAVMKEVMEEERKRLKK